MSLSNLRLDRRCPICQLQARRRHRSISEIFVTRARSPGERSAGSGPIDLSSRSPVNGISYDVPRAREELALSIAFEGPFRADVTPFQEQSDGPLEQRNYFRAS